MRAMATLYLVTASAIASPLISLCLLLTQGMSQLSKNGKGAKRIISKLPYICSRCRDGRLSLSPAVRSGGEYSTSTRPTSKRFPRPVIYLKRSFSTTAPIATIETVTGGSSAPPPLPLSAILTKTSIRDQLRVWSVKNEEKKSAESKDGTTPVRRQPVHIPQSQWLEDAVDPKEEQDDYLIVNEYDDRRHCDGEVATSQSRILPGDIIFLRAAKRRELVLLLAKIGESAFWLHPNGKWSSSKWRTPSHDMAMGTTIHNFASDNELAEILKWLPKRTMYEVNEAGAVSVSMIQGDLPRSATDTLTSRMKDLLDRMKAFRRAHLKSHDQLYDQIAPEDDYTMMPFHQLVQAHFGFDLDSLDDAGRMSIYLLINKEPTKMLLTQLTAESSLSVLIMPKRVTRTNAQVIKWSRRYQQAAADASKGHNVKDTLAANPLTTFINKARTIITASRRIRSPTTLGCLGPSNQATKHDYPDAKQSSGQEFSETDKEIIGFIWDAFCRVPQPSAKNACHAVASLILRAVGAYPKMRLDGRIGRLFLQELGASAPWAEIRTMDVLVPKKGQHGALSRNLERHYQEVDELTKNWPASRAEGPLPVPDAMSSLRKDHDLPVFCIDLPSTRVIDDGISVEPSKTHPGAAWLHVHIAHPSAFFDPDSPISQSAKATGTTDYGAGSMAFMIHPKLSHYLALGPGAEALTVSSLIDEAGKVLDIQVSATRLKKVVHLNKHSVNYLLGHRVSPAAQLIVGPDKNVVPFWSEYGPDGSSTVDSQHTEKAKEHLLTLTKMNAMLLARFERRAQEMPVAANFWTSYPERNSYVNFEEHPSRERFNQSFHYLSDPTIKLTSSTHIAYRRLMDQGRAEQLVTHAMWLCCESMGKWAKDRNIPAVWHGTESAIGFPVEKLNAAPRGSRILNPSPVVQPDPVPHLLLNMQQYCRMTSPLRRYPDLICLWNVDAYLRAEADGVVESGAPATLDFKYPMSKEAIVDYLKHDFWAVYYARGGTEDAYIHWAFQALFRAFHFKEADLPEVWDVRMDVVTVAARLASEMTGQLGWLRPFDLRCIILKSKEGYEERVRGQQYLPCKIELVDATQKQLSVRAVGEPTDEPGVVWKDVVTPENKRCWQGRLDRGR